MFGAFYHMLGFYHNVFNEGFDGCKRGEDTRCGDFIFPVWDIFGQARVGGFTVVQDGIRTFSNGAGAIRLEDRVEGEEYGGWQRCLGKTKSSFYFDASEEGW